MSPAYADNSNRSSPVDTGHSETMLPKAYGNPYNFAAIGGSSKLG